MDDGDELAWAGVSPGGGEFLLVTAQGQAIRFGEDDVRPMGLPAGGIGGVKLQRKIASSPRGHRRHGARQGGAQPHVALITTLGVGKHVPVAEFPARAATARALSSPSRRRSWAASQARRGRTGDICSA